MAREEAGHYHSEEDFTDDKHVAHRKERARKERCKKRKASTIRQGIDHYYSKKHDAMPVDETFDDCNDYDDFDPPSYH